MTKHTFFLAVDVNTVGCCERVASSRSDQGHICVETLEFQFGHAVAGGSDLNRPYAAGRGSILMHWTSCVSYFMDSHHSESWMYLDSSWTSISSTDSVSPTFRKSIPLSMWTAVRCVVTGHTAGLGDGGDVPAVCVVTGGPVSVTTSHWHAIAKYAHTQRLFEPFAASMDSRRHTFHAELA